MNQINSNKFRAFLLYLLVTLFLIFEMAVQVSPSIMTLQLMEELKLNTFQLGIMSGIYFYTYAFMQIPAGILLDRFSPRYIVTIAVMLCIAGTFLFGFTHDIYTGCLGRLLMGTGSAFAFISVLVVTADLFPSKYFSILTGVTQMLAAFGAMIGQLPLSILVNAIGWRSTLFLLTIIGLLLTVSVWHFLRYKKESKVPMINCRELIHSLQKVINKKQTWIVGAYAMLLWAPMSCFTSLWGVPYLMVVYGLKQTVAASLMASMWLGLALASPVLGWFSTVAKSRTLPLWLSAFIGSISFAIILIYPATNIPFIAILLFIAGAACSGQALSFTSIKENNDSSNKGTAIAFNNMAVVVSGAILQPLIGKILQVLHPVAVSNLVSEQTTVYATMPFKQSMLVVLFCYLIGAIIAFFFIKETYNEDQ